MINMFEGSYWKIRLISVKQGMDLCQTRTRDGHSVLLELIFVRPSKKPRQTKCLRHSKKEDGGLHVCRSEGYDSF